jgi:maltokinase
MNDELNLSLLSDEALRDHVTTQRWFGAKSREVSHFGVLETMVLKDDAPPMLVNALLEVRFGAGTHEVYQLPLGFRPEPWELGVVVRGGGWAAYDALQDPELALDIYGRMRADAADEGFHAARDLPAASQARSVGVEQSNTSVVFDDATVLKLYRRVEPGENPELELLRFLSTRGFAHIAPLAGWWEMADARTMDATLGILQDFVADGRDGWEMILASLQAGDERLADIQALGVAVGELHAALGSDASDPDFAPEEPSVENLALLTATIDEEIERVFRDLPENPELETISYRGEEVREKLRGLSTLGAAGKVIRHHGDLHLGQVLLSAQRGWVILDFEGEPARSLPERRRKRSPLRDVAGMLRSFAYAAAAVERQRGTPAPEGWEARAREAFLVGYRETADPSLLPPSDGATQQLLSVFELEKAVYELRYELDNRPDWVGIPVAAIVRLLDQDAA